MLTDAEIKRIENPAQTIFRERWRGIVLGCSPGQRCGHGSFNTTRRPTREDSPGPLSGDDPSRRPRRARTSGGGRRQGEISCTGEGGRFAHLTDPTLADFADRYYREQVAPKLKGPGEIRRYLDNEICPFLGKRLLKDIASSTAKDSFTRNATRKRPSPPSGCAPFETALRLRTGIATGHSNPAAKCATRYIGRTKKRTPSAIADRDSHLPDHPRRFRCSRVIQVGAANHLAYVDKKSELRLTEWKDVDFEAGQWFVPRQTRRRASSTPSI